MQWRLRMAYRKVEAKGYRAKINFTRIEEKFPEAVEAMQIYAPISPREFGVDWNRCILEKLRSGGIVFNLGGENGEKNRSLDGILKNTGHNHVRIDVDKNVTGSSFNNNYIINSLYEAVDIAAKLEIIDNEILPGGDSFVTRKETGTGHPKKSKPGEIDSYRAFAAELLEKSSAVIVSKVNNDFGDYIVAETGQGWLIAYNTGYGEAPYIVADFEALLLDKQTIKEEGLAIRVRRDPRGNWKDRIRGYM